LPVKKAKLVKAKLFLETTTHGNAGFPSAYNGHGIICVAVGIISIFFGDSCAVNLKSVSWMSFLHGLVSIPVQSPSSLLKPWLGTVCEVFEEEGGEWSNEVDINKY
jgi:hypothetical protein